MRKKRILIIDDEERIRKNYSRLFKAAGKTVFEVIEAGDVIEAAEILTREQIDLVLLDIRMPGIKGREMFNVIHTVNPNIHIIVASVYPIERQKQIIPEAEDYYDKSQGLLGLLEKATNALT